MADVFNVGEVIRDVQNATVFAVPPRVTPYVLDQLLIWLEGVTAADAQHLAKLKAYFADKSVAQLKQLDIIEKDLDVWKLHLLNYRTSVDLCKADNRFDDSECTLWSVIAPLFFGFFDGPTGTSLPSTPTLRQPLMIANRLNALLEFAEDTKTSTSVVAFLGNALAAPASVVSESAIGTINLMKKVADKAIDAGKGLGNLLVVAALGFGAVLAINLVRKS